MVDLVEGDCPVGAGGPGDVIKDLVEVVVVEVDTYVALRGADGAEQSSDQVGEVEAVPVVIPIEAGRVVDTVERFTDWTVTWLDRDRDQPLR